MTMDTSVAPHITTIEVAPPTEHRWSEFRRLLKPYVLAPLGAAALVVLVAFAEAYPISAAVLVIFLAALAGPLIDQRHRRSQRAEINKSPNHGR